MERVCRDCGSMVNGDAKFCPVCGKTMERAVELTKQQSDVMPPPQTVVNAPAGCSAPRINTPYVQMTTGEWVLTIIVCSFFGLISLILNIVWAFGSNTPEPKRTFCRAMFFVSLATTILGIIVGVGFMIYIGVWLGGAF